MTPVDIVLAVALIGALAALVFACAWLSARARERRPSEIGGKGEA